MKILILYATTEGQTRKIARFLFSRLADEGHAIELASAGDADGLSPGAFDAAILAGSVHAGRYQKELIAWSREHAAALDSIPTLFLSVSLAAAGNDTEDRKGLDDCVEAFEAETGWKPGRVEHVAGAFRFRDYDFFSYWAMRWIAAQRDEEARGGHDKEYTDWAALGAAVDTWIRNIGASPGDAAPA